MNEGEEKKNRNIYIYKFQDEMNELNWHINLCNQRDLFRLAK